jgi:hypothetical protein
MRLRTTLIAVAWKFAVLLLAFNLLLLVLRPEINLNFDAGTENRIMAERYVYGATPAAVLVGSSLGHNIARYLPSDFYGMAFSGGSPITGAEIILRKPLRPRVVVVETNVMERPRDQSLVDRIFDEPGYTVRRILPGFRAESRPVLIVTQLGRQAFRALFRAPAAALVPIAADGALTKEAEQDGPGLAAGLALQLTYNAHFDATQKVRIAAAIADLKSRVDLLRRHGICVLLTRLPIEAAVDATPLERYQADAVRRMMPPSRYDWIDIANDGSYHTVDGLHMTGPSGIRVAWLLSERVRLALDGRKPCRLQN